MKKYNYLQRGMKQNRKVQIGSESGSSWIIHSDKYGHVHRVGAAAYIEFDSITREIKQESWKIHGKFHRLDGPAVRWDDGGRDWYINDELHRLDGPAMECANGEKYWYIMGKDYKTEEEWFNALTEQDQIAYLFKINKYKGCNDTR